jgi:hypothetical protein
MVASRAEHGRSASRRVRPNYLRNHRAKPMRGEFGASSYGELRNAPAPRTQLRSILRKVKVERQADLLRVLASVPSFPTGGPVVE